MKSSVRLAVALLSLAGVAVAPTLRAAEFGAIVGLVTDAGGHSVHRESSEGCSGSSKFHTVSETGMVAVPCDEEIVTLPV